MKISDAAFAALALLMTLLAWAWCAPPRASTTVPARPVRVRPPEPPTSLKRATLGGGETLGDLLERVGIGAREVPDWVAACSQFIDPRALPIGLQAEAVRDHRDRLLRVTVIPDWRASVLLERRGEGIVGRREQLPIDRELVVVRGVVSSSLFAAVVDAGEADELALSLADLFQWDIDFYREVQRGDTFAVLVERLARNGRRLAYGQVVAAEYVNAGKRFTAFRYLPNGGKGGYYDAQGRPVRKQFLRAPLRFSRLSSRFSSSRLHPVYGKRLPHWGVDYAAPAGTPIMATADGTVISTGWKNGGGNTVELRHPNGFTTSYMHLSHFGRGIVPGVRVSQGETLGYVGSTGVSTGPHLDYRVARSGRYVNPLAIGNDPAPPLPAGEIGTFRAWADAVAPMLTTPGPLSGEHAAALRTASAARPNA